ncbi:NADH-specific methylglyoxal reductase [compost metagenome]
MTKMPTRRLGRNGPEVSALGLGCMSYMQPGAEARREAVRTIQAALDAGFTFLDTADFYGSGISEMNIGQAIRGRREQAFLSVKFGVQMSPTQGIIGLDGRPKSVKNFAAYSLRRLGVEVIDLYQPARVDPDVPYEETIGAVADLIQEGKVRYLGVSEVGADLLRRAHAVHPVTALEIEYSLACRFIEAEILPTARELGVGIVPYRILADGLLSGAPSPAQPPQDTHFQVPRMQGENYVRNRETAKALDAMAAAKGVTPAQLAIAWVLSRGDDIVPITGISCPARVVENMGALAITLTAAERAELDHAFAPDAIVGARYPEAVMEWAAR